MQLTKTKSEKKKCYNFLTKFNITLPAFRPQLHENGQGASERVRVKPTFDSDINGVK